jgi:hypothetical protein
VHSSKFIGNGLALFVVSIYTCTLLRLDLIGSFLYCLLLGFQISAAANNPILRRVTHSSLSRERGLGLLYLSL